VAKVLCKVHGCEKEYILLGPESYWQCPQCEQEYKEECQEEGLRRLKENAKSRGYKLVKIEEADDDIEIDTVVEEANNDK